MFDLPPMSLAHLKARGTFAAHVETAAIAFGREEHLIVAARDHFGEIRIELHEGAPALEVRRAEILEPEVRTLHAIERAMGPVGERHHCRLGSSHLEVADELASKGARRG